MPEQQIVEIAKAIGADAKILIMDEPTASLTDREVDSLFKIIALAAQPRRRDHLYLAPIGGNFRDCGPRHGPARRRDHRHDDIATKWIEPRSSK